MIEGGTHAHLGPIWYHSEPSDVTYSPNQELVMNFFCRFLQQTGSSRKKQSQMETALVWGQRWNMVKYTVFCQFVLSFVLEKGIQIIKKSCTDVRSFQCSVAFFSYLPSVLDKFLYIHCVANV